jgi:hypothetical protein
VTTKRPSPATATVFRELDDPAALVGDVRRPVGIQGNADRAQRDTFDVPRDGRDRTGTIDPADCAIAAVCDVDAAVRIDGHAARGIESRLVHRAIIGA